MYGEQNVKNSDVYPATPGCAEMSHRIQSVVAPSSSWSSILPSCTAIPSRWKRHDIPKRRRPLVQCNIHTCTDPAIQLWDAQSSLWVPNPVTSAGRCQLRPSALMSVECQWQGIIASKNSSVQIILNTGTGVTPIPTQIWKAITSYFVIG
jgi:hypothetical protein